MLYLVSNEIYNFRMKQKRNIHARHESIVSWVVQHGQTPVETLAREFSTSEVTIRKDLTLLAEQGRLIRQHGGAAPLNKPQPATNNQSSLKQAIGQLAASLVNDSHKIVIDSGSTTATMVEHLKQPSQLVVMTNSLDVANQLVTFDNEPTVLMTGGTWDKQSQSFQGNMAGKMLQSYSFDLAFVGAAGLDVERGTTTYNELTLLSQEMARVAGKVVVLAESTKLRHKMPNIELAWQQVAVLVTDDGLPFSAEQQLNQQGVKVMKASLNGE